MSKTINLNAAEIQSGFSRVHWAEILISQLPKDHEGRNSWLLNYGQGEEAKSIRGKFANIPLSFDEETQSANLAGAPIHTPNVRKLK